MHYRNDEFEYHYRRPKSFKYFAVAAIILIGAAIGALASVVVASITGEKDLYWEGLSDAERIELCSDYTNMGEEEMQELLEVFGTMSEDQEAEFDTTIKAAKEHC